MDPLELAGVGVAAARAKFAILEAGKEEAEAEMALRLPYVLLRRGRGYDVRRYPSFEAASSDSGDAVGKLSAFLGGANSRGARVAALTPTLLVGGAGAGAAFTVAAPLELSSHTESGGVRPEPSAGASQGIAFGPFLGANPSSSAFGSGGGDGGLVVAVARLSEGDEDCALLAGDGSIPNGPPPFGPPFECAQASLLAAVARDGLAAPSAVEAIRATYSPLQPLFDGPAGRPPCARPIDEVWLPLATHDWM